jgi:nucleoid DNA-binding protein
MNKSELLEALSKQANLPLRKAEEIANLVSDTMAKALVDGGRIEIRGFRIVHGQGIRAVHGKEPQDRRKDRCDRQEAAVFQDRQGTQGKGGRNQIMSQGSKEDARVQGLEMFIQADGKVTNVEIAKALQVNPLMDMRGRTPGEDASGEQRRCICEGAGEFGRGSSVPI